MSNAQQGRLATGGWQLAGLRAVARSLMPIALAMAALVFAAPAAHAKDEFLPPEQAYKYSLSVERDQLIVSWKIAKGYYLYKKKLGVASAMSTVQLDAPAWPKGEIHTDEYFGEQEIYRNSIDIAVPIKLAGTVAPSRLAVELKLQGCADAGLCYPPNTDHCSNARADRLLLLGLRDL